MAEDTEVQDAIRENATGPAAATGDSGSVTQHNLKDQIAADQHLSNKAAALDPWACLRWAKIIPRARCR